MAFLLQLLVIGVLGLLAMNIFNAWRGNVGGRVERRPSGPIIDGVAEEVADEKPGAAAASALKDFENATAALKSAYPSTFAMLGGYLNAHAIEQAGGVEAAVKTMIEEWAGRREEISSELTKLLAETEHEEAARAFVVAACDADFELEGYRKWLIWLLGRFNAL
ncbi:MAG: hypothetical protein AAFX08_10880 [Pseudomonadota bacterium]